MKSATNNHIVVAGMHRSGTSAFAGVLSTLGACAGNNLLKANQYNANGYYESEEVGREHDALLSALGRSWSDERPMPSGWLESAEAIHARIILSQIFKREFSDKTLNVMKDPRICRLLPLWKEIFIEIAADAGYVIMLRAPDEVIRSLQHRDGIHPNKAALLYVAHLLDAERDTRGQKRVVVNYSDLLQDWISVLANIQNALDIDLPVLSDDIRSHIQMFLNPSLRHFGTDKMASSEERSEPLRLARKLHYLLKAGLDQSSNSAFDSLRSEYVTYLSSLEPWLSASNRADILEREILRPGKVTETAASHNALSVLYFDVDDTGYSETRSLRQSFIFGAGQNTLRFILTDGIESILSLRLDITDRPALCEFHGVWIDSPQGERLWHSQQNTKIFANISSDMKLVNPDEDSGVLWIASVGYDPHAIILIPKDILARLSEGWVLGVEFTAMLPTTAFPKLLGYIEMQSNITANTLRSRERDLDIAERTIQEQEKEINRLTQQIVGCRNDITRAQAQIELLKEIFLKGDRYESI